MGAVPLVTAYKLDRFGLARLFGELEASGLWRRCGVWARALWAQSALFWMLANSTRLFRRY